MMRVTVTLAALALLLGGGQAKATELIVNGRFETGDFTGWTVNAPSSVVTRDTSDFTPHSGNWFAALGTSGATGTLSQTVNTSTGMSYTLSLWLGSDGGFPNEFDIEWNGSTLIDLTNIPSTAPAYTNYTFTVLGGPGTTSTLTISERDDPGFLALDDVSLTPVVGASAPEPSSLALLGMASAGITGYFGLRRRKQAAVA